MSFLTSLQSKQMFHICKLWISEAWGLTVTKRFADSPVHQSFMMQNGWGEIHIRQSPEEATRLSCYVWFWNNLIYSSLNSSHSNAWLSRAISRIPRVWPAAMSRSMNSNLQHLTSMLHPGVSLSLMSIQNTNVDCSTMNEHDLYARVRRKAISHLKRPCAPCGSV